MNEQIKALSVLQQIDMGIAAANRELAALDAGAQLKAQVALGEKKLGQASEALEVSESELRDKELNLKSIEAKKQSFEKKLYEGQVTNPKELSSIEKEIEMLGRSRTQLDGRILELYDIVERQQAEKQQFDKITTTLKSRLTKLQADFKAKSADLASRLAKLNDERAAALALITDRHLVSRYESIRSRHKDTGLAKLVDGKCGGCHVGLTSNAIRALESPVDGEFETCDSCGRILFKDT